MVIVTWSIDGFLGLDLKTHTHARNYLQNACHPSRKGEEILMVKKRKGFLSFDVWDLDLTPSDSTSKFIINF